MEPEMWSLVLEYGRRPLVNDRKPFVYSDFEAYDLDAVSESRTS